MGITPVIPYNREKAGKKKKKGGRISCQDEKEEPTLGLDILYLLEGKII